VTSTIVLEPKIGTLIIYALQNIDTNFVFVCFSFSSSDMYSTDDRLKTKCQAAQSMRQPRSE